MTAILKKKVNLSQVFKTKNSRKIILANNPTLDFKSYPDWTKTIISSPPADGGLRIHQNPTGIGYASNYHV